MFYTFSKYSIILIVVLLTSPIANGRVISQTQSGDHDHRMHPVFHFETLNRLQKRAMPILNFGSAKPEEEFSEYWNGVAQDLLMQQLNTKSQLNTNMAKNVIMFLGDGMSIPTITAGRVYLGGEEKQFSFEKFPYVGLSKTYCANSQVADSACTATAYLGGVKGNYGTLGVTAAIELDNCQAQNVTEHHVTSIAGWAQAQGMATGLITTTSVTHASPAGVYAHAANRFWENDAEILNGHQDPLTCTDIASQLIHGEVGAKLNVILGGGQEHFLPLSQQGKRLDGRNLIDEWLKIHGPKAKYVQTKDELQNLAKNTEHVLGLFASNHMPYHLDADPKEIPSLEEMVSQALDILEEQSQGRGYFLFVEGGRIDHAHHDTLALKALDETAEFDKAIHLARQKTSEADTLIVVTSDHSHTMSVAGYSSRKNDIVGINNGQLGLDDLPYATLSYANGPGFDTNNLKANLGARRKNLKEINMKNKDYMFPATVPLESETHGGDDVGVFASGPFAHLFTGVYEQNLIPHAMAYASCLGSRRTACGDGLHKGRL
uniref:Alkaline phosphatase n=2 Tax=Stomoxys calcitrans TaxID=35570 RepID=A0A1I8P8G3_STOCA|nr:unnamed protein product [Stomoxys calcitrans]